ncbi:MAG: T9SS type A sorting domain-containing protein [bacterium]
MKKYLAILILGLCAGQVRWEYEIIDSQTGPKFSSLTIGADDKVHVIYDKIYTKSVVYAYRTDSNWQIEVVDTGYLCNAFSISCDESNAPHISYFCRYEASGPTYVCHGHRQNGIWVLDTIDSIIGTLGNYWIDYRTSIDIDTAGLPGVAYIAWNVPDSIHYIKYAHFNGTTWDTSIVEYDSAYANIQLGPTDYYPCLRFDRKNTPHIAFGHCYGINDTLKIATYVDSNSTWFVEPVLGDYCCASRVSLGLSRDDRPCIAFDWEGALIYSWCDSTSIWHFEGVAGLGQVGIRLVIDLDNLDNPHIVYLPDPLIAHPCYVFKRNGIWYDCGWIEPDPNSLTIDSDVAFDLDANNQPNVCYPTSSYGFKYAKGTFMDIKDNDTGYRIHDKGLRIKVHPNISYGYLTIEYSLRNTGDVEIEIYDVIGAKRKSIKFKNCQSGNYTKILNLSDLASGVYFVALKQNNEKVSKKFILMR